MILAPPQAPDRADASAGPELLIKEARARAWRRRVATGTGLLGLAVVLVVVAVLGGFGTPVSSSGLPGGSTSPVGLNVSACAPANVRVSLEGGNGGAGTFNQLFRVRNVSNSPCSITGYPEVRFLSATHHVVPQRVVQLRQEYGIFGLGATGAPAPVDLKAHGGVASFWILDSDVPSGNPPAACVAIPLVRVGWTHAATGALVTLGRFHTITSCGRVTVFPVVAGAFGASPHRSLAFYFGVPSPKNPNYGSYPSTSPA